METTERYRQILEEKELVGPYGEELHEHRIEHFTLWLRVPLEKVTRREMGAYVDHLLRKHPRRRRSSATSRPCSSSSITSSTKKG